MAPDPGPLPRNPPVSIPGAKPEQLLFTRLAIVSGLLAAAVSLLGLVSAHSGLIVLGGTSPNSRAIALSAALAWIVLGSVLAYSAARPFGRAARLAVQAVLFVIAALAATEFAFSVLGSHFFVETLFVQAGTVVLGPLSYPVSPVAAGLVAASAVALAALLRSRDHGSGRETWRTAMSIPGIAIALVSFTFILSYAYGDPLLYGTRFIPIALLSALAAFFTGVSIVAAAGPGAVPARYLIGDSTSARLLRVFIPLVAAIIILENFAFVGLASVFGVRDVVLLSASLVVFLIVTAFVVARASGGIGKALDEAEAALAKKNDELANLNEELSATGEELRQTNDELVAHERRLVRQNEDLNAINEELTSTQEELRQTVDDLTRMETILRESEEQFRTIAETLPALITVTRSADSTILFTNRAYDEAFGFKKGEIIGRKGPGVYWDPADRAKMIDEVRKNGSVRNYPLKMKRADGTPMWVLSSVCQISYKAEPAIIAASIDTTELRRAEEALRESQARLESLFAAIPDMIVEYDTDGKMVRANEALLKAAGVSGFTRDMVLSKLDARLADGRPLAPGESPTSRALNGATVKDELMTITTADGRRRTVSAYAAPLFRDGKVSGAIGVWNDITELKRAEESLRESEERFRSVLDSSRDFIYRLNLQTGIYEYVSPSVNYVLGYTPEEFAALDPGAAMERVHPDDLAAVNEGLKGLSETGSADMEYRLRTKSGEYRWVSNILSTVNDSAGRPLFRGGTVRDITRRKEAEEQIQATLQRFYHILSGMPYGILLVTDEDRVEFANQAFCDIFGLSDCPGELANITAARMMEKIRHAYRDPDAALARIREIVGNGEPVSGEDVPMSSGRVFLRDFLPVRLGEKRSGRLWIHVDITARRQAEEALRQSERRLARSQEISHLGSWELDLANNRLAWSDEVYRIFGLRPQEFGATYEAFLAAVHPDDRSAVDAAYSGSLREGRDTYEIEHRVVRKDTGEIRYVHEKCEHQRDENGKIIRSVGMVHDITERKQAEDALREAEARFRLALKNAPVSVAVQDKNLVFRWAYNQRTRSTGEIVGKTDADLFAPEDMEWLLPLKHKVLETGSEVRAENWVTSNGQRVFLDLYLEPIRNPAGEITGIGIAAVNLTELKIAEDALREAQLRTTAILEGIADTFYSLDDQWRFTMVNPAAEKAPFGRPAADLLGRVIWDLYPELVGTKIHRHYLDAAKKKSMEHYESRSPLNGRWYEVFMKGQKGGVDVYMRDISGRRQAEEALRGSEEKYRNLFTNMTEEVHFWKLVRDEEGRIVTWRLVDANPPTLKTWGKTREEILGKTTDEIFGPGATGHYMPVVQKIMAEGVPYSFEDYFPNLDKYFRFTSVPFGDYFITTGADITGIKKAEIELRKKNEDLGSLNEEITATQEELHQNIEELSRREHELSRALAEKEVLLSEIHHRVKNNLTAFISLLSLEGSTEDTEAGKLLKLDLQNRARSMALIHETLYKTHMYDEVDMGMYLTTLVEQISNTFRTGRPVTTVVDAHGVVLDIPRATPAGLIVNELVTNSLKYAFPETAGGKKGKKPAATITISLAKNDGEYVMAVKDNGAGLPPGFDLETTQTLGLKLVNFLARHQMRAKVEVRREKGTEFVFRFRE